MRDPDRRTTEPSDDVMARLERIELALIALKQAVAELEAVMSNSDVIPKKRSDWANPLLYRF